MGPVNRWRSTVGEPPGPWLMHTLTSPLCSAMTPTTIFFLTYCFRRWWRGLAAQRKWRVVGPTIAQWWGLSTEQSTGFGHRVYSSVGPRGVCSVAYYDAWKRSFLIFTLLVQFWVPCELSLSGFAWLICRRFWVGIALTPLSWLSLLSVVVRVCVVCVCV